MRNRNLLALSFIAACGTLAAQANFGSNNTNTPGNYIPGVTFQKSNPNYPIPNPLYFEGKIDYEKLEITTPSNFWEYLQRGLHYQDDLMDTADALADYQTALSLNNLQKGTCQIVTSATLVSGALPATLNPPACMFTIRLRLAYLLRDTNPTQAIELYNEVLMIDPQRLGIDTMIGETYVIMAQQATGAAATTAYQNAVAAYKAEFALSPVTATYTALTGDTANNEKAHWELAAVYQALGDTTDQISELQLYLQASKWHSDVYPWRIPLAQSMITQLQAKLKQPSTREKK